MSNLETVASGFIVYQSGCATFGYGSNLFAAKCDAAQWSSEQIDEPAKGGGNEVHGKFYYLPATAALIQEIARHGGQVAFFVCEGVACTESEAE
jgi:hypothetical protein